MKIFFILFVLLMVYRSEVAQANSDTRTCIGHMLYDGNFAQYCYTPSQRNNWEVVLTSLEPKGFEAASFLIQKEVCLRRRMNGRCWRSRREVVKVIIYERKGMSFKESRKIFGILSGLTRSRKIGSSYRLYKRSFRRGKRIELRPFKKYKRFFVGIQSRNRFKKEKKAAQEFIRKLTITITKPH